jgi:DNA processing protein
VTARLFEALFRHFDSLDDILLADRESLLQIDGVSRETADRVATAGERLAEADRFAVSLRQRDIKLITRFDRDYPKLLCELNDPPPLLYVRGSLPDGNRKSVALVGAEQATAEGIQITSYLAKEFVAEGMQIISSLVGGIDAAAHLASKTAGGASFAIIESGLDKLPRGEGLPLAIDIVGKGGLISEYAPEAEATATSMGQTNRLLVGLAQAIVVTESYADSNRVLDLLRFCREIGKLVFFMIDPEHGALADEKSLSLASESGAIPIEGYDRVKDIIKSLV